VGRFRDKRGSLPTISLNADSAVITCIANDYGFHGDGILDVDFANTNACVLALS
jgi:hypothetical protein